MVLNRMLFRNTAIFVVVALLFGVASQLGCKKAPPEEGTTAQASKETEEQVGPLGGHDYFIFSFGDWGGVKGYADPASGGNITLNVTDASTMETVMSFGYASRTKLAISPDASRLLLIETLSAVDELPLLLTDRISGEEIWNIAIKGRGENWASRIENVWWDIEKNYLIVECKAISKIMGRASYEERKMSHLWWFVTLDLATGEEIAILDLIDEDATGRVKTEDLTGAQYSAGRLYLVLPDYPLTDFEEYDNVRSVNSFDIYAIDTVTGESEKIEMRGLLGRPVLAKYFVLPDGESIIAQTEAYVDDGTSKPLGGFVQKIDTATGEWETLLDAGGDDAYNLHSVNKDGSKICYTHYKFLPTGFEITHNVRNLADGRTWELPITSTWFQFWLSPSGEYVAALNLIKTGELTMITVDTGETRLIAGSTDTGFPNPVGFLGELGNGM